MTLRTSRTSAAAVKDGEKPISWTRVVAAAAASAALAAAIVILVLYLTRTTPFATSSSPPTPSSSSTGVGTPQIVYATDVVIPTTGSFTWHVNSVGNFEAGDVVTLTCSSAPGFAVTGVVVDADSSTDTILVYVGPGGTSGTPPSQPVTPWVFAGAPGPSSSSSSPIPSSSIAVSSSSSSSSGPGYGGVVASNNVPLTLGSTVWNVNKVGAFSVGDVVTIAWADNTADSFTGTITAVDPIGLTITVYATSLSGSTGINWTPWQFTLVHLPASSSVPSSSPVSSSPFSSSLVSSSISSSSSAVASPGSFLVNWFPLYVNYTDVTTSSSSEISIIGNTNCSQFQPPYTGAAYTVWTQACALSQTPAALQLASPPATSGDYSQCVYVFPTYFNGSTYFFSCSGYSGNAVNCLTVSYNASSQLFAAKITGGAGGGFSISPVVIPTYAWTHVCLTWQASTTSVSAYLNGTLVNTGSATALGSAYVAPQLAAYGVNASFANWRTWNASINASYVASIAAADMPPTTAPIFGIANMTAQPLAATADGVAQVQVAVTLVSQAAGQVVTLTSNRTAGEDVIYPSGVYTTSGSEDGVVVFYVTSVLAGPATFTATYE